DPGIPSTYPRMKALLLPTNTYAVPCVNVIVRNVANTPKRYAKYWRPTRADSEPYNIPRGTSHDNHSGCEAERRLNAKAAISIHFTKSNGRDCVALTDS